MNQIPKNKKNLADSVSTRFSMVAGGVLRTTDLRLIASRRFAVPKTAFVSLFARRSFDRCTNGHSLSPPCGVRDHCPTSHARPSHNPFV